MPVTKSGSIGARAALLLVSIAAHTAAHAASGDRHAAGPVPSWVLTNIPAHAAPAAVEATDGVEYLAIDRQIRLAARGSDSYTRIVQRIVSEAGVDEASSMTFDFDPHSDQITLHSVKLLRDGHVVEQIGRARETVMRREDGLESGLLDGTLTLSLLLEDVRPGDIIDYSYSLHHFDAVLGNRYFDSFTTQWSDPVAWSRIRLLQPLDRELTIQMHGMDSTPVVTTRGDLKETTWVWRDLAGITDESERPSWHILYPRLRMSEWRDWSEVVQWGLAEYSNAALTPRLQAQIGQWRGQSREQQIVSAVRFVQDQVRYTGIEIGPGAYRPTEPDRVLERRYGDCKDKVLLLTTLLRGLGIDASPALVNTSMREHLDGVLPSPGVFDHAIVRIRHDGATYWFDATDSLQGGVLETMAQAHYGAALVIASGVSGLESIPSMTKTEPTIEVSEAFDLRKGVNAAGALEVTTIYSGADADEMRRDLQAQTSQEISRKYVDYYRDWYPGVQPKGRPVSRDDRDSNRIEITEHYEIDPAFDPQSDGSLAFSINPYIVRTQAAAPALTVRTTPLAVTHPVNVRYRATVLLPESWPANTGTKTIDDPAFAYRSDTTYADHRFEATYEFRTLVDVIDARRAEAYAGNLAAVLDDSQYSFTHPGTARLPSGENLNLGILLAAVLGIGAGVSLGLYLSRRVPASGRPAQANAPIGIVGWMLLPVLHTCLLPALMGAALFAYWPFLDVETWDGIAYGASVLAIQWFKLGYLLLLFSGVALMIAALWAIGLLFTRNRRYPFAYISLSWGVVAWTLLAAIIAMTLPGDDMREDIAAIGEVLQAAIAAGVWSAYMLRSERVRATFTRDPAAAPPMPVPQPS